MYYTVIKDNRHLRTRGKCRQHEPQASVFYISRVFSNVRSVLSQCNTRLRLLHLLYDVEVMWRKTIKHAFSMFYTLIKHGVFDQSERGYYSIYIINIYTYDSNIVLNIVIPALMTSCKILATSVNFLGALAARKG